MWSYRSARPAAATPPSGSSTSLATSGPASLPPATNPLPLDPKYDDYDFPTTATETRSGHPGFTTPEQDAQVFQLRVMLEAEGYGPVRLDTLTLLRFLRARKFDVIAAKAMYELKQLMACVYRAIDC